MANIVLPAEGVTGPITIFRSAPYLGLSNDDTADGTEVIFEGNIGSDHQTWERSADGADGCTAGHFTITNKGSGTLLTKISDTGNLLICAASSTVAACTGVTNGESLYLLYVV